MIMVDGWWVCIIGKSKVRGSLLRVRAARRSVLTDELTTTSTHTTRRPPQQDIQAGKTNAVLALSQADKDGKLTFNHQVGFKKNNHLCIVCLWMCTLCRYVHAMHTPPPCPSLRHTSTQPQHTTQVDDNNTISPTLSLKKGYLTYTWTHLLGDGAKLETTIDPFNVRGIYVGLCVH